jgi:gliding motility-associated-like protein
MKKALLFIFTFIAALTGFAQSYNIATENGNTINTCSGNLYDSGGPLGDYSANEDYSVTICPDTPGDMISIEGLTFILQNPGGGGCADYVQVFSGIGTGGVNLGAGALCGTITGLNFTSISPDGCLTITFFSNGSQQFAGFDFQITCKTPCLTPTAALVDASDLIFCSPLAANSLAPYTVTVDGSASTVGSYTAPTTHSIDEYIWDWGDGTITSTTNPIATHDYSATGIYVISLSVNDDNTDNSPEGCSSTNAATRTVYIAQAPDIQTSTDNVNCGDCVPIEVVATSQTAAQTPPVITTTPTVLPDGGGVCFTNSVDYTDLFPAGATMAAGCYPQVCLDLDHTYARDLRIRLIAPTGESVVLYNQNWGGVFSYFLLGDCSPSPDDGAPGCPRTYCFVNNGGTNLTGFTTNTGNTGCCVNGEAGNYVVGGTFNSNSPFSSLDGAELNGVWSIEVCDLLASDDGTLHSWSLTFPPSCFGDLQEITPNITNITWTPNGIESSFSEISSSTAVFAPGPDDCPTGETCEGNQLTSTATVCFDNPTLPDTYTYGYMVTDQYGCEFPGTVDIVVNCTSCPALADMSVSGPQEICIGASSELTINVTAGTGPTFDVIYTDGTTNFTLTGIPFGTTTVPVTPTNTTTYTIVSIYDNGEACFGLETGSATITVNPLPTITATATDLDICIGESTDLSAAGGTSYTWNNGLGAGASHTVAPTATTIYQVTGTDANGCVNSAQVEIIVNTIPVITASATLTTLCAGEATDLSATGGISYTWDNGLGAGAGHTVTPASTTIYQVTGTDANGCSSAAQIEITVNELPNVSAGLDVTVCDGDDVTLSGSGAVNYVWDNGVADGISFIPTLGTTTYTVIGTGANGCTNTDLVDVTVNPLPTIEAGNDQEICEGDVITLIASGGVTYSWDNGVVDGEPFTPEIGSTVFTVTGVDANGCVNTATVTINVFPVPIADFIADPSTGGTPLDVLFTNNSSNGTTYTWDFGNGEGSETSTPSDANSTYTETGEYTVVLIVDNGICSSTFSTLVIVFNPPLSYNLPNIFTPNGDESNDIMHLSLVNAKRVYVEILNRWGNLVGVIDSVDPNDGWDGLDMKSNKPVSDGVYFYKYEIEDMNGEVITGHHFIHLNR